MKVEEQNEQGITLVALVVTIIVLLILAGVTISLVLGQAGIFSKAGEAKERTTESQAIEKVKLAVLELRTQNNGSAQTITLKEIAKKVEGARVEDPDATPDIPGVIVVDGMKVKVDENFGVSIEGKAEGNGGESEIPIPPDEEIELPSTAETAPYLPEGSTIVKDTNLDTGLVMKDKNNNEWVWVEVPKSITANSNTDTEIETVLENYSYDYVFIRHTDIWYEGCGLTKEEYNNNKSKMLQSIKKNGGFWIGRYETGNDTIRTAASDPLTTPLIQQDKYPYNWVTVSQAQGLASQVVPNSNYTSSLLYGIQWNLTCKYMEEKGYLEDGSKLLKGYITTDSRSWGNYSNSIFEITRGKYATDEGKTYTNVIGTYKKMVRTVLLTTGITKRNMVLNIYDFAGNEVEWTLEKSADASKPCAIRGGYNGHGNAYTGDGRGLGYTITSGYSVGFRFTIYK